MMTRRSFFLGAAGPAALPIEGGPRPLKVVCVGAHPDDPESGCGGTLARYTAAGHKVAIIHLTRGERGLPAKPLEETAAIRTAEAEADSRILGAKAVFAGQIDGATEVNAARAEAFGRLMAAEEPDVVFTHWPIDTHPDHQAAALLTFRSYRASRPGAMLYFYEVESGFQSLGFQPTSYVDITSTRGKKKAALFIHKSHGAEIEIYRKHHEIMENFRGREAGVAAAEAFVLLARDGGMDRLPGA